MAGKFIVIEGLDGSGKATQSALLADALAAQGGKVRRISFPNYESPSSAPIKMYLNGDFGTDPSDVNAYAASLFYAVDRYAGFKQDWGKFYEDGGILVADRYTTSNAVHQCAKLPREEWDGYLRWLFDLEYGLVGIPTPDIVVYLDVDPQVSQKLMSGRYQGDETKKDIHESNVAYLQSARQAAAYCAQALGWVTIPCAKDGAMRTVEEIHQDVMKAIR